jgi:uncharacterized protein (TIGR02118 family)
MAGRPFLFVRARVRPAVLPEFRRWYRTVHVPHALAIPGIVEYRDFAYGPQAAHGAPNVLSVFVFQDETVIQKALQSPEAESARRDWERWEGDVRDLTIQIYAAFDIATTVRHLN